MQPTIDLPPVIYRVEHHTETEGRIVSTKNRRLDAAKLKTAQAEFRELEWQGVIRPPGGSPLDCSSFAACLLACAMRDRRSSA